MFSVEQGFTARFTRCVAGANLTTEQRALISEQYIPATEAMITEQWRTCLAYHTLMVVGLVFNVCVTALISIQQLEGLSDDSRSIVFWITLVTSIVATIAIKLMYSTGIYRQYIVGTQAATQLESEGWNFLARSGRYEDVVGRGMRFRLFVAVFSSIISSATTGMALSAEGRKTTLDQLGSGPPPIDSASSSDDMVVVMPDFVPARSKV
jgi:Protein of unknown function (DUF4231)